jgi:hypothetical protein
MFLRTLLLRTMPIAVLLRTMILRILLLRTIPAPALLQTVVSEVPKLSVFR